MTRVLSILVMEMFIILDLGTHSIRRNAHVPTCERSQLVLFGFTSKVSWQRKTGWYFKVACGNTKVNSHDLTTHYYILNLFHIVFFLMYSFPSPSGREIFVNYALRIERQINCRTLRVWWGNWRIFENIPRKCSSSSQKLHGIYRDFF